jgi:hypothetical protein
MIIPTCGALINGEASYSFTLKNRLFAKEDELSPMVQHERDQERKDVLSDTNDVFGSAKCNVVRLLPLLDNETCVWFGPVC